MKIYTIITAILIGITMTAGVALAGSVDIGLGHMDQGEFDTLQQMVAGNYQPREHASHESADVTTTTGLNAGELTTIRAGMQHSVSRSEETTERPATMVDIGLGSMATDEFCQLDDMVASGAARGAAICS